MTGLDSDEDDVIDRRPSARAAVVIDVSDFYSDGREEERQQVTAYQVFVMIFYCFILKYR